jgi:hypothetical protein
VTLEHWPSYGCYGALVLWALIAIAGLVVAAHKPRVRTFTTASAGTLTDPRVAQARVLVDAAQPIYLTPGPCPVGRRTYCNFHEGCASGPNHCPHEKSDRKGEAS